jgi:phosphohistidine phosphatase
MKLLVIRHGPAGDPDAWKAEGRADALRPLTPDGKNDMRQAAAGLATLVRNIDVLVSSPLVRAVQTAEIVADEYDCKVVNSDTLEPERDPEEILKWLREQGLTGTVGLVGHEPHLSSLVGYLLAGKRVSFIDLKKGGACLLEVTSPSPVGGTLQWLLTRRELGRLGEIR